MAKSCPPDPESFRVRLKYTIFSLLAILIWAGNTVVSKMAAGAIEPAAIAFDRWLLAALLLTPFLLRPVWRSRAAIRPYLAKLSILSLLGMVLYQSLAYFAAETTSATNMGIIASLMPLLTIVLASLLLREPPTLGTVAGGLVSLLGLMLLIGKGQPAQLLTHGIGPGDGLMLLATLAYAGYGVLLRKWPMPIPTWHMLYVQICCAVLLLLPAYWLAPASPITAANLPLVLYAGIAASIVSAFLWIEGIGGLGAARASMFMNLMPVFTALIAIVLLSETLHLYHVIGGGVALAGVILAQVLRRQRAVHPASPREK
jgi:drug/metabolite transporter (DMT)-like permease